MQTKCTEFINALFFIVITPEEVGLTAPARRCGSAGQPLPQVTLAVQYNNKDSHSVKICLQRIQDVFIPIQLTSEYTHLLMEVSIQPDPNRDTLQTTEELPLTKHLQDNDDDHKHLQLVLPLTFNTHPVYSNIVRDKMDGRCVCLKLCLRKSWEYGSSIVTIASTDIPMSSAIKLVTPHTFYLTHTEEFLSQWEQCQR